MAKVCANISFMYSEYPFLQRYEMAKKDGFTAVESGFPFNQEINELQNAKEKAGLEQILINTYGGGDPKLGYMGYAALPGAETEFKESLSKTLKFAKALNVNKIHIMAGNIKNEKTPRHDTTFENNLKYAVNLLKNENIIGLIEPLNKYSAPNYYLNNYNQALSVVKKIDSPHLKLMFDMFHIQQIHGDITHALINDFDFIGHIQVAQVPMRNEPDSPGELNYQYLFKKLQELNYQDWVGLEYIPTSGSNLNYLKKYDLDF